MKLNSLRGWEIKNIGAMAPSSLSGTAGGISQMTPNQMAVSEYLNHYHNQN
jgi:hypothetical protein